MDPSQSLTLTPQHQTLVDALRTAAGLLDPALSPGAAGLNQQIQLLGDRLLNPTVRIAVFAPFNYGKSTLLNALLGQSLLPADLIPTTGTTIRVVYGAVPHTTVHFHNGDRVEQPGTEGLAQVVCLDQDRRMRDDIAAVTVTCNHPLLRAGVELVDLPGTDDRVGQDDVVKTQLLTADIVLQVLDGRKLMTLREREQLRDWLLERGIEQVVFVVNFLNLLDPEGCEEVTRRLRFVAESFRANLPAEMGNVYRVDALPALRAQLRGDKSALADTGLPVLATALDALVSHYGDRLTDHRMPRLRTLALQVQQTLQAQITVLETAIRQQRVERDRQKAVILKKAQILLQQGFEETVAEMRRWLSPARLGQEYGAEAATALQQLDFEGWVEAALRPAWIAQQKAVVIWTHKACDFFDCPRPVDLHLRFPSSPDATLPTAATGATMGSVGDRVAARLSDRVTRGSIPTVVAGGLGFLLGGPAGAALLGGTSYMLERSERPGSPTAAAAVAWSAEQIEAWYASVANEYLRQFSTAGLAALDQYITTANPVLRFPIVMDGYAGFSDPPQQHQLTLLRACGDRLGEAMAHQPDDTPK